MNKLILMRGVPGSGKSFTANKLAETNNGMVYSTDDYWGNDYQYKTNFAKAISNGTIGKLLGEYHAANLQRTIDLMGVEYPYIIVDNTNIKIEHVAPYVETAKVNNYEVVYQEPDSVVWRLWRNKTINNTIAAMIFHERNQHGVPVNIIEKMLADWEEVK